MPTDEKLLELIAVQTEVARLGWDLGGLMQVIVQRTLGLVGADGAAVELVDGDAMVCRATAGLAQNCLGLRLRRDNSLSGLCLAQGRALSCDDAQTDSRADRTACQKLGIHAILVVPLRHQGENVGVLKAMSCQPGQFRAGDLTVLELLSGLAAAAMYFAKRHASNALFHQATHDGLTNLPNRALFLDRLRASLAQAVRDRQPLAVMMLDMNGLKPINDHFGHRAGDAALLEFARRLSAGLRQSDTAARLGGDEFGVLLRPLAADGGLEATMKRLGQQINGSFLFEGRTLRFGASMGAARFPEDGSDFSQLIDLADQRMYQHKRGLQHAVA